MWPERPSSMLANLAPNLSQLRKLRYRAMQQDSDCAFQEASKYACRRQRFEAMLFRCIEYLKETWLVYLGTTLFKQKILDSVHKSYIRWIYYHFQERTRWKEDVQRYTLEILGIREWGGKEQKAEKNGGVFWERPGHRRGCSFMDGWMDVWMNGCVDHFEDTHLL